MADLWVVSARTGVGRRSFVIEAECGTEAVGELKAKIDRRERLTDALGGIYLPIQVPAETLTLIGPARQTGQPMADYLYGVDGRRLF